MENLNLGLLLLLVLVLACPLIMMLTMRGRHRMHDGMHDTSRDGMHGMRGDGARGPATSAASPEERLAELKAQQDAVEREIAASKGERRSPSNRPR